MNPLPFTGSTTPVALQGAFDFETVSEGEEMSGGEKRSRGELRHCNPSLRKPMTSSKLEMGGL